MAVGVFNTAQIPQDLAKKSFSAMITRLMPNGSAPLFGLTALLKEETAAQIEHGFYSKTMLFPSVVLSAQAAAADTTLNVASTANILPGMMLRADTTNENILVTAILGTTQLAVQRAVGNISAAIIAVSTNLWMVGNAYEESSLRPASLIILPTRVTNYTQIYRNTWAVSETTRATMLIAGDTAVAESRRDCAAFHAIDIEKATIFGQRFFGSRNGQPFHTMDGLISSITQNNPGNITTLGATTNYTQLIAALDPVFNQVTDPTSVGERLLFVGGAMRNVLHQIFRLNGTYFIEDGQTTWGLQFDSFKIPRGRFNIIEHPLLNAYGQATTWARMGIAVDLATFNLAYMQGRKTVSKEFNTDGQPSVDNGVDAVGGTLTSELTCLVKNPAADAVLYNATAGAAG
jgi:Family of unknown function (DUF5309)